MKSYKVMAAVHDFRRLLACQIGVPVSVGARLSLAVAVITAALNHSCRQEQCKMRMQGFMTFSKQRAERAA